MSMHMCENVHVSHCLSYLVLSENPGFLGSIFCDFIKSITHVNTTLSQSLDNLVSYFSLLLSFSSLNFHFDNLQKLRAIFTV